MVGLFGTKVVPRSQVAAVGQSVAVQPAAAVNTDVSDWLGPQVSSPTSLLDLTASFSVLPFSIAN
jgi:hypothetical protein